jgi:hypothetical protein
VSAVSTRKGSPDFLKGEGEDSLVFSTCALSAAGCAASVLCGATPAGFLDLAFERELPERVPFGVFPKADTVFPKTKTVERHVTASV